MTHLEACSDAAAVLGVSVHGAATVKLPSGSELIADLLIKHFGATAGTLVFSEAEAFWPYRAALEEMGHAASSYAEPSEAVECSDLREMRLDRTWCGSEAQRPSWA